MPKQIKKQQMSPKERTNRICAIISLICSIILAALIIFILPSLTKSPGVPKALLITVGYVLFTASCVVHCTTSFKFYFATDSFTGVFHGVLSFLSALFCLFNLRFVLVMLFSAMGSTSAAKAVVGSKTMTEFTQSQLPSWICMLIALIFMTTIGVLGIIRIVADKRDTKS